MTDNVNHPSHYTDGKIEVIDFVMPLMYVSKQVNKDNNTIVYKATLTIVKEDLKK